MRYTEEQRIEYVRSWEQTNLSRKQYSISESLSYASFLSWTKKYGTESNDLDDSNASFVKLESGARYVSKILLPNGVVIQTEECLSGNLLRLLLNV